MPENPFIEFQKREQQKNPFVDFLERTSPAPQAQPSLLDAEEETFFQEQFKTRARRLGLSEDPDDPLQFYDHRAAFKSGIDFGVGGHLPSRFKKPGHPNQFVELGGVLTNTITGNEATEADFTESDLARQNLNLPPISKEKPNFTFGGGRTTGKDKSGSFQEFPGERLRKTFLSGAAQTVGSMLGAVEWLAGSDIARDLSKKTRQWARKKAPKDPNFFDQVVQGFGSAAIFFIPGMGISRGAGALANISPRLAAWLGVGVSTALESATEAGSVYQNVLEKTGDKQKSSKAATNTLLANIPLIAVTNRLGPFANRGGTIKKAVNSALTEAFQEGAQEAIGAIAEERPLEAERIATAAGVGGIVGGPIGAVGGVPVQQIQQPQFQFADPALEQRFKAAKGVPKDSLLVRTRDVLTDLKNKSTREFEHLPKTAEFAPLRFDLLRLSKQKGVASDTAVRAMSEITQGLDENSFDVFTRKVVFDDLVREADQGRNLPFGLTPESIQNEMPALDQEVQNNPAIQEALQRRTQISNTIRDNYVQSMENIGLNIGDRLNNENYFRHQVLEFMNARALYGTGKRLKTPSGRGFLRQRRGSELDINTDYLQAEHEVFAQMLHDIEIANTINRVDQNYNIVDQVQADARQQGLSNWRDAIPDTHTTWQPREGNVFYMANSIPENLAEELFNSELETIEVSREDIRQVLAMGRRRREFVLPNNVAETLDNLQPSRSQNFIHDANKEILKGWKIWVLGAPRRVFKYNFRNLTGDAEAVFIGNPSAFKQTPRATKELYNLYFGNGELSPRLQEWFERGGMQSTMQVQEIGDINRLTEFRNIRDPGADPDILPVKAWKIWWNKSRNATDFRESILRYSAYLDYAQQMEASGGTPKNFGASIPEEIMGLSDIRDRAFFLSNDLLGAYDRVSITGKALREQMIPFWSWKETNFRRFIQFGKNAVRDGRTVQQVGRSALGKLAKSPYIAARAGKFLIKATAFWSALQAWNHLMFPEEEKQLPEKERTRPHVILGRDDDGNIISFNRIGVLGDFLEWFGLDAAPGLVDQWMKGKKTLKEIAIDIAKEPPPVNVIAQAMSPLLKVPAEIVTRRGTFPDVYNPRTIRDRGSHIAQTLGLSDEYKAVFDKPSRGYPNSLINAFIYKTDPEQAAYSFIQEEKFRFLREKGKFGEGFWLTPKGDALYNYKLALKYKDKIAADKYLQEYSLAGGTGDGLLNSITRMHPLLSMNPDDMAEFTTSLDEEGQRKLKMAERFWEETLANIQ